MPGFFYARPEKLHRTYILKRKTEFKAFKVEKEEDVAAAVDAFKDNLLPAITEAETAATAKVSPLIGI